jgi:hypothetical protein
MKTKIDLEALGEWKREVEAEIEKIVQKRFPNTRIFAYLMIQTMGCEAHSTKTISRVETLDGAGITDCAKMIVAELEFNTTGRRL